MLYHFIVTPLVIGVLLTAWVLFQNWFRSYSPEMPPDCDVLRGRFGSCGACFNFEACHLPEDDRLVTNTDILEVGRVNEVAL